jgi:hypothetical protein
MIQIVLTDDTLSYTFQSLEVPLTVSTLEGAVDVVTLDNNMSTYFTANKRQWTHTWAYMTETEYNVLKGFYDRQWTLYKYPNLTIADLSVSAIPVRMSLNPQNIIDHCITVNDVTVTFRESIQMPDEGS